MIEAKIVNTEISLKSETAITEAKSTKEATSSEASKEAQ